jgi:hypothetical protein
VPARSIARVTLAATVPAAYRDGTMTVTVDAHTVDVPFAAESVRDVRVRVAESPLTAAPGEMVRIVARVVNAGDVAETLSLGITDGTAQVGVLDDASSAGVADDTFALNIANSKPQVEPKAQCRTLAPGAAAVVALQWRVPSDVPDGDVVEPAVVVSDVSGERARGVCAMVVRDRAWLSLEAPPMVDGTRVRYTIRNSGSTTARDVEARFAHATVQVEAIAAGATTFVEVDQCDVGSGGSLSIARREVLALPCIDDRVPAVVHAAFHAPERVVAGAAFMLRLDLDLEDAVDVLAVRVPGIAGCRYVPGSTRLDGRIVLDRAACTSFGDVSPLDGDGLFLRGVAGGTRVSLAWSLIADTMLCDEPLAVSAVLDVDGETRPIAPVQIAVFARDAFPARPAGARYHVEACTVAQPEVEACIVAPSEAEACTVAPPGAANMLVAEAAADLEAVAVPAVALAAATAPLSVLVDSGALPRGERRVAFSMRLDSERVDDVARLLHGARGPGLVAHVFMMRLFFPDAIEVRDVSASDALDAVRDALRDVFDRLFVKLRIPGFDVSSDDLEDPVLRRALLLLFERLDGVVPERIAFEESPGVFDRDTVRRIRSDCADAPYGAPALLRALVALLPSSCDDDPALATALRRYASLLDAVLSRYEGLPLELFDDALARRADAALDDARDGILTALRAHVPVAPVAC